MRTSSASWDGHEYRVEIDEVEVTSFGPRPDPNWTFTDAAGHEHDASRALLVSVLDDPDDDGFYFDADGEEHNSPRHSECRLCGERITQGTVPPSLLREFVPGDTRYYRDDEPITAEEFNDAVRSAVRPGG